MANHTELIRRRVEAGWWRLVSRLATKSRGKIAKDRGKTAARRAVRLPDRAAVLEALRSRPAPPHPDDLSAYAFRVLSQRGEDGIVNEILTRIGFPTRRSVEIGCGWNGGNSGLLAACFEFDSLMIDGNSQIMEILEKLFADRRVTAVREWVTAGNVNELVRASGFAGDIDYLGIDLDGVDYWVWHALTVCDPQLVVAEYNPYFGGSAAVTIPDDPAFDRHDKRTGRKRWHEGYWGASLAALAALAARRGYRLVATSPEHTHNAFFLKRDRCPEVRTLTPAEAWRPRVKGSAEQRARAAAIHAEIQHVGVTEYFRRVGCPLVVVE